MFVINYHDNDKAHGLGKRVRLSMHIAQYSNMEHKISNSIRTKICRWNIKMCSSAASAVRWKTLLIIYSEI